jgi:predicted DNA-binding mobile mystery protein A
MSQADLAERLAVSGAAVNKLEHAEPRGAITVSKLAEVAVYALVPNSTLEQTVLAQARAVAKETLGYAARTMALEAQGIDDDRQRQAVDQYAQQLAASGDVWRAARGRT